LIEREFVMQIENSKARIITLEAIGKRIARLRSKHGWTQQALATRLAISRVAISHIEMNLSLPSERTVILLAGMFKLSPHALVAGTTYPQAKAERLPAVVCCYTELELEIALLQNDLSWIESAGEHTGISTITTRVLKKWRLRLAQISIDDLDENERKLLAEAQQQLASLQTARDTPQ
jgi:transcriptional regulator with XRE-family HTH domain